MSISYTLSSHFPLYFCGCCTYTYIHTHICPYLRTNRHSMYACIHKAIYFGGTVDYMAWTGT
jgi:hypothetical protein